MAVLHVRTISASMFASRGFECGRFADSGDSSPLADRSRPCQAWGHPRIVAQGFRRNRRAPHVSGTEGCRPRPQNRPMYGHAGHCLATAAHDLFGPGSHVSKSDEVGLAQLLPVSYYPICKNGHPHKRSNVTGVRVCPNHDLAKLLEANTNTIDNYLRYFSRRIQKPQMTSFARRNENSLVDMVCLPSKIPAIRWSGNGILRHKLTSSSYDRRAHGGKYRVCGQAEHSSGRSQNRLLWGVSDRHVRNGFSRRPRSEKRCTQ